MSGVSFVKDIKGRKEIRWWLERGTKLRGVLCVYSQGQYKGKVKNIGMWDDDITDKKSRLDKNIWCR